MEEFQESDVFWADHTCREDHLPRPSPSSSQQNETHHQKKKGSVPVQIPEGRRSWKLSDFVYLESDGEDNDRHDEMVPPHVMMARRVSGQMSFSVCTGNGRTLKGRDLSRVRNSVLRMTGFLEG